jgi:hypothetical protein
LLLDVNRHARQQIEVGSAVPLGVGGAWLRIDVQDPAIEAGIPQFVALAEQLHRETVFAACDSQLVVTDIEQGRWPADTFESRGGVSSKAVRKRPHEATRDR